MIPKFFIILLLSKWIWAQIDGTCEECIDFIQTSTEFMISDPIVDLTEDFLKNEVCKQFEDDVQGCQQGIEFWYKPMINAGLSGQDFGKNFCYHYGICRDQIRQNLFKKVS